MQTKKSPMVRDLPFLSVLKEADFLLLDLLHAEPVK